MWFRLSIGARLPILFHHHVYFVRIWCDDEILFLLLLAWLGSLFRLVRHKVQ